MGEVVAFRSSNVDAELDRDDWENSPRARWFYGRWWAIQSYYMDQEAYERLIGETAEAMEDFPLHGPWAFLLLAEEFVRIEIESGEDKGYRAEAEIIDLMSGMQQRRDGPKTPRERWYAGRLTAIEDYYGGDMQRIDEVLGAAAETIQGIQARQARNPWLLLANLEEMVTREIWPEDTAAAGAA